MKKIITITALTAFILGILIAVIIYCGYVIYQMNAKVDQNTKDIKAIVYFINESISKQNTTPVISSTMASTTISATSSATTTDKK